MSKKCSNQIEDGQHKWSDKMVKNTRANTIIVGELSVKDMAQSGVKIEVKKKNKITKEITKEIIKVKSKKLNRSTQNQGYISRFVRFLTYKAEKIGKRVIEISEKNTTKRCYACGKLHNMPLSKRIVKCDCGNIIDRDRNSAVNIMIDFLLKYNLLKELRRFMSALSKEGLLVPTWINI
jgi:putative transposase